MHKFTNLMIAILRVVFTACILAGIFERGAKAEVTNERNAFEFVTNCQAYQDFLAEKQITNRSDCNDWVLFLFDEKESKSHVFLRNVTEAVDPQSTYRFIAEVVAASQLGREQRTFLWAELASLNTAVAFSASVDQERIATYGTIFSELKLRAVRDICFGKSNCDEIEIDRSFEEILGRGFSNLDDTKPDVLLFCLLKTDGYLVPIRQVLGSAAFRSCISTHFED